MGDTDQLEAEIMSLFNSAMSMRVVMSEDDSVYDLNYIREKLAKVGAYQERLSDIQMALTKRFIVIIKSNRALAATLRIKEKQLKATGDYAEMPLNEKGHWLENQLVDLKERTAAWSQVTAIMKEVKAAVADRVVSMRHIDGDLRLHVKIYEQRVAAGATSPSSYKGN